MADTINYIRKEGQRKYVSDTEFTSLDKSTIPVGTEYNIVGVIEESDLSSELQTKINSTITIEQTTGSNTGAVMSQNAVTTELGKKQPLIDAATTLNLNSVIGSGLIQGGTIVAQSDMRAYATLNPNSLNFTRSDETPTIVTDNSTLTIPSNKTGTIATTDDITAATQNFITAGAITGKQNKLTSATGITITTGNTIYCNGDLTGITVNMDNVTISENLDISGSIIQNSRYFDLPGASGTLALTSDIPASLIPGDNISISKASDSEKVTISATGLVKQTAKKGLYGTDLNSDGTPVEVKPEYTATPGAWKIPQWNANGQLRTNNPTDPLDAVNKQYFEANSWLLKGGTAIPADADLNDYKTPGNYCCDTNATAVTIKNNPSDQAFTLKVFYDTGTGYAAQWLIEHYNLGVYIRYVGMSVGSWKKLATEEQLGDYLSKTGITSQAGLTITQTGSGVQVDSAVLIDNSLLGG